MIDKTITPQAPVVVSNEIEPKNDTETYEASEKPIDGGYIAQLWQMGEASNHFTMPELVKQIDKFVLDTIDREGMVKNQNSFKEIVDKYEKKVRLPDNVDIYTKTERIAEIMRIDQKLYDAWKEKEDFMRRDPSDMSTSELRKLMERI